MDHEYDRFVDTLFPNTAAERRERERVRLIERVDLLTRKVGTLEGELAKMREIVFELDRHRQHLAFLREASTGEDASITPEAAIQVADAWSLIRCVTDNRMPVPAAMTGPDGQMFYSWDRGRHHLELVIIPGQPAEFFYRDRETRETWFEEYEVGHRLPDDTVSRLRLLLP